MAEEKSFINQLQVNYNWKVAIIIALSLIILLKLGFWQLYRAEQKRQLQIELLRSKHAVPKPIESLIVQNKQTLNNQRVLLTGRYINDKSIYVSNKIYQRRPGYEVITPFIIKSSNQIVLISRGWIALSFQQKQLPTIDLISGEQELIGSIFIPTKNSFFLPEKVKGKKWPIRLHHFQIDTVAKLFQTPILPYVVRLEAANKGILLPFWPITNFNSSRSTAYALQWFFMALLLLVISIIKSTNIVQLIQSKYKSTKR